MKITVLFTTYNWKEALELLLLSIFRQSLLPYEIVIADDGSTEDTRELIDRLRAKTSIPIQHIWHPDEGYRKTFILNKALKQVQGDYIIQVDGDMILHRHFVRDHNHFAKKNCFIRGYRIMLDPDETQKAFAEKQIDFPPTYDVRHSLRLAFHSLFLTRLCIDENRKMHKVFGLLGCNMSFWKEDALRLNGFDQDITGWGGEDTDFGVRLFNAGLSQRKLKYAAIQHHLYHIECSRDSYSSNKAVYDLSIEECRIACKNGLKKY